MTLKTFFLLNILFYTSSILVAQPSGIRYSLQHYTSDNGLPQNSIRAIQFDNNGFCWLASEMGLVRFDGANFTYFNKENLPQLASPFFRTLTTDAQNNIYSKDTYGTYVKIVADSSRGSYATVSDKDYLRCVIGYAYPASRFEKLMTEKLNISSKESIIRNFHYAVLNDSTMYVFQKNKLHFLKGNKVTEYQGAELFTTISATTLLHDSIFLYVYKDNKVAAFTNGSKKAALNTIQGDIGREPAFIAGNFRVLWCAGRSFIFTNQSLYEIYIADGALQSKLLFHNLNIPQVVAIYYSKKLNLYFIGSNTDGLYIIKPTDFRAVTSKDDILFENNAFAQTALPDSTIFANNFKFHLRTGAATPLFLSSRPLQILYCEGKEKLWYGFDDSLKCYNLVTKKTVFAERAFTLLRNFMLNPYDSVFYVATKYSIARIVNNKFEYIFTSSKFFSKNNTIFSISAFSANILNIVSNTGYYQFDIKKGIIKKIRGDLYAGFSYTDEAGNTWLSSYGEGFHLYKDGRFTSLPLDEEKKLNVVNWIIEDRLGYLWLPTNGGLFRVKKQVLLDYAAGKRKNVFYDYFDKSDGFNTNEFNGGGSRSAIILPDGTISLVSLNGLVWFQPSGVMLSNQNKDTRIFLDKIIVDSFSIDAQPEGELSELSLSADFSRAIFKISMPHFGNTQNVQLEYIIAGLEHPLWQKLSKDGQITINNLSPGHYNLKIRNNSGGRLRELSIPFTVRPWFYQTWWFRTLLFLAIGACVYFFIRLRIKLLVHQKEKLERQVQERTNELSQNVEQLKRAIKDLELSDSKLLQTSLFKEKLTSLVLHDLRSPLRFLSSVSGYISAHHKNLPVAELEHQLAELTAAAGGVYYFTQDLLSWINTQANDFSIKAEAVSITEIFKETNNLYSILIKQNGNTIHFSENDIVCKTDKNILKTIVRNLVDNANKYTVNNNIYLLAIRENQEVKIVISDDGKGMPPSIVQAAQNGLLDGLTGADSPMGLKLISDLTRRIRGTIKFESEEGIGTTVTITIPDTNLVNVPA
jgi:signal transduction histidine kinase